MKNLTKEEYEYLNQFRDRFDTATKSDYMRNILKADVERIQVIYKRVSKSEEVINVNCGACIFNLIKSLAPYFYGYKEEPIKPEENETSGNNSEEKLYADPDKQRKGKGGNRGRGKKAVEG